MTRVHERLQWVQGAQVQLSTDGRTVWVNGEEGLLGRLGPRGVDIHATPGSGTHCLDCGPCEGDVWPRFVAGMRKHHQVQVPETFKPEWCRP